MERTKQAFAARIPLQRYGNPEEVAKLMLFLASDEGSLRCIHGRWRQIRWQSVETPDQSLSDLRTAPRD